MTNLSRLAANLQAQVNDLRDDNDRLARSLNHSTERLAALRAKHERHCREDDERAELLTAERDQAQRDAWTVWSGDDFDLRDEAAIAELSARMDTYRKTKP